MKSEYVSSAFIKEIHFDHEIDAPVSCKNFIYIFKVKLSPSWYFTVNLKYYGLSENAQNWYKIILVTGNSVWSWVLLLMVLRIFIRVLL